MTRLSVTTLRAAWWADRAAALVRRRLISDGLSGVGPVSLPPPLPPEAGRVVEAVLMRRGRTCLERALVLQAWHAAGGTPRDVVIGVGRSEPNFQAHAWLDGDPSVRESEFEVLHRRPPRDVGSRVVKVGQKSSSEAPGKT